MRLAIYGVKEIKYKSFPSLLCLLVKLKLLCKFMLFLLVKLEVLPLFGVKMDCEL